MSSKNRNGQSKAGDRYYTDPRLARILTKIVADLMQRDLGSSYRAPRRILEPSAGIGAFVGASRRVFGDESKIVSIEMHTASIMALREQKLSTVMPGRFEDVVGDAKKGGLFDLVIGNPPYTRAEEHIRLGFDAMTPGAWQAQLLRQGFYSTAERSEFWKEFPLKYMVQLVERPSFTGGGNDSAEYALFVWQKFIKWPDGFQRCCHLSWKKKVVLF